MMRQWLLFSAGLLVGQTFYLVVYVVEGKSDKRELPFIWCFLQIYLSSFKPRIWKEKIYNSMKNTSHKIKTNKNDAMMNNVD